MPNWLGLAVPIAYVGILLGSLATFSSLYRKRKAASSASLTPWFPPHLHRNIYLSLLHIETPPNAEKPPQIPDSVLKAALLQRACEDIRRVLVVRKQKQPLSQLLQKGSVGDELWQRFQRAEKEVEAELRDVVEEVSLPHLPLSVHPRHGNEDLGGRDRWRTKGGSGMDGSS